MAQRLCNGLPRDVQDFEILIRGGNGVKTELHVLRKGR